MSKNNQYNSLKERLFFEETTKREMHLIIEQFASLLKSNDEDWVDKAISERRILKLNSIE